MPPFETRHPAAHTLRILAFALVPAALLGCDEDTTSPASVAPRLSLSVVGVPAGSQAASSGGIVLTDPGHTLEITRARVVVREIELERQFADDCDDLPGSEDDCEEFSAGPLVLDLPLDGSVETLVEIEPDADVYDEIEFEIHKPEDDSAEDLAFLQANPEFDGISILVEGSWDGEPFIFTQDLNEEQERELFPPLEVAPGMGPINVTLSIDVSTWFVAADGSLIDPSTALKGGVHEDRVEENIEASIDAFDDEDRDGDEDDDEDDDDHDDES